MKFSAAVLSSLLLAAATSAFQLTSTQSEDDTLDGFSLWQTGTYFTNNGGDGAASFSLSDDKLYVSGKAVGLTNNYLTVGGDAASGFATTTFGGDSYLTYGGSETFYLCYPSSGAASGYPTAAVDEVSGDSPCLSVLFKET